MIGSLRNINEARAASIELERIYNLEKEARKEAENANRTKDFFLSLVSHELRSPLNSILGWTNILLQKDLDENTRIKALETIKRSAQSQAKLLSDLVDSARITSGKLSLEFRPLNILGLLENIINSHLPSINEKNIEFDFMSENENLTVLGDTNRLRQVFSNILGNSIKFTNENGRIRVKLFSEGGEIIISVEDNGHGISETDFPHIFRRFTQGNENNLKGKSGLGLGLSIAKILVEKHRGRIYAESEGLGLGAKFTIKLPIISDETGWEEIREAQKEQLESGKKEGKFLGLEILIVEDDEDSRNVLEIFLNQFGAVVKSAESVTDAFDILETQTSGLPDLIISDIGMPNEDGYSFIKRIRKSKHFKDIPAIALSAFTAEENKRKALSFGFQKYHTKPFEPDLLVEEIKKLLDSE
jgi:CheY-like chemotaxis protein